MRKFPIFLSALCVAFSLFGCSKKSESGDGNSNAQNSEVSAQPEELKDFTKYDLGVYMKPLWLGDIVYNETVMLVGNGDYAPLLYPATEIISVRSYDLSTEYERGGDYEYDEDLQAIIRGTNKIPYIPLDEYYPPEYILDKCFSCNVPGRPYIFFAEGSHFSSKQLAVTYRHGGQGRIEAPKCQKQAFSSTLSKLENNEPVKLLFYGDSITVGANSSGFVEYAPYAPTWTQMVFDSLTKKYGATNAEYVNTAVGGWTTRNGISHVQANVVAHNPDAVFIGFGMNDTAISARTHVEQIKTIIDEIKAANPNVEICLISTMLPNPEVSGVYYEQYTFEAAYEKLIAEYHAQGYEKICLAPVTSMHQALLQNKRYYDMTGNNVNHPNDFLARAYAQTVFQTVCGYDQ